MNKDLLNETLHCLGQEKWIMHFSKDCYATFLLDFWLKKNGPSHVRDIKKSNFGKLLDRPVIKSLTSVRPVLESGFLDTFWPEKTEPLVLTLGTWGNKKADNSHQISRNGHNLVLQVNLSEQWDKVLHKLFNKTANEHLDYGHPINLNRSTTLGWVRIDFDFETDEILIEEVQSDLVRRINSLKKFALKAQGNQCETFRLGYQAFNTEDVLMLTSQFNSMLIRHWQEALLWSALWFCTHELGMDNIFYHTFETGALLKNIKCTKPPKSLYTELPKKFCFTKTQEVPKIILQTKSAMRRLKTQKNAAFFKLAA